MKVLSSFLGYFLIILIPFSYTNAASDSITWENWSSSVFERASSERRLVLLDLEAVWCHWCHVMHQKTYSDPEVARLINSKFIAVKVDQDSRPDLSNRYKEYGWPATIIFDAKGNELRKLSGYIEKERMAELLSEVTKNPSVRYLSKPVSYSKSSSLDSDLKAKLERRHLDSHDYEKGGLDISIRYLDSDSVEYALLLASQGDAKNLKMAEQTLRENLALFDPVWGGVYQYSTHRGWDRPHFEKIARTQANNLRIYSLAYALKKDDRYLKAAEDVQRYIEGFLLSPEGAFYTSQDADLRKGEHSENYFKLDAKARMSLGVPTIDKSIYARENGWFINALTVLYSVSGNRRYLENGLKAANWVYKQRLTPGGGFRHGKHDQAGPYLGDTLYMAQAMLSLYAVTGKREWLKRAEQAALFIASRFAPKAASGNPGYLTAMTDQVLKSQPQIDENISLVRFTNLLSHYTGNSEYGNIAKSVMNYLTTPSVATNRITETGILLADQELNSEPLHITIVGAKESLQSEKLFRAALAEPSVYKRTEWWDRREGAMPNSDVQYPELEKPAAFVCTKKRCSLPIFEPGKISKMVERFSLPRNG